MRESSCLQLIIQEVGVTVFLKKQFDITMDFARESKKTAARSLLQKRNDDSCY